MKTVKTDLTEQPYHLEDGLLYRWQKRRRGVLEETETLQQQARTAETHETEAQALPTDSDMPAIESLNADSDFSGFLSPKVSEPLRRLALRKLFHCEAFNIRDGLDDYDGDYTSFAGLGNIITADIKHQLELEVRKQLDAALDSDAGEDTGNTLAAAVDDDDDAQDGETSG